VRSTCCIDLRTVRGGRPAAVTGPVARARAVGSWPCAVVSALGSGYGVAGLTNVVVEAVPEAARAQRSARLRPAARPDCATRTCSTANATRSSGSHGTQSTCAPRRRCTRTAKPVGDESPARRCTHMAKASRAEWAKRVERWRRRGSTAKDSQPSLLCRPAINDIDFERAARSRHRATRAGACGLNQRRRARAEWRWAA